MQIKKKLTNLLDQANYKLGNSFFKNGNLLSYNLFNFFFKKNICNKKYLQDDRIKSYYENGFAKLKSASVNSIDNLNHLLIKYNPNIFPKKNYCYVYKINDEILAKVKDFIEHEIIDSIKIFEKYYNLKIILADAHVSRNYSLPSKKDMEYYSNYFHCDGYNYNLFKVFVNLEDIDETQGPLTLVKKDKRDIFFQLSNYKNRNNYRDNDIKINECLYKNTGKKGDIFLCSTTELLHKAGDIMPGKSRTILFLEFIAYPFDENINLFSFMDRIYEKSIDKQFAKISGLRNLYNLYKLCQKNKLTMNI
jgi:hypothetical protein